MHYLIIDTCVWVELAKTHHDLRRKLRELVDAGKVRLLVSAVVVDEWERRKPEILDKAMKSEAQSFRGSLTTAMEMIRYLQPAAATTLTEILGPLVGRDQEHAQAIAAGFGEVDDLLTHSSSLRIEVLNEVKVRAADWALAKKAPFGTKNSMADALILLGALDYVAKEGLSNCIFVSANTHDFGSNTRDVPHDDLKEVLGSAGVLYYENIAKAIDEVEKNLVSLDEIESVEKSKETESARTAVDTLAEAIKGMELARAVVGEDAFRRMLELNEERYKTFLDSLRFRDAAANATIFQGVTEMLEHIQAATGGEQFQQMLEQNNERYKVFLDSLRLREAAASTAISNDLSRMMEPFLKGAGEHPAQQLLEQNAERLRAIQESLRLSDLAESASISESLSKMMEQIQAVIEELPGQRLMEQNMERLRAIQESFQLKHTVAGASFQQGVAKMLEQLEAPYKAILNSAQLAETDVAKRLMDNMTLDTLNWAESTRQQIRAIEAFVSPLSLPSIGNSVLDDSQDDGSVLEEHGVDDEQGDDDQGDASETKETP